MGILALEADERVSKVKITKYDLSVTLKDGRTISVPLVWYPRLFEAKEKDQQIWEICGAGYGIHWPTIDEDLCTEGLLRGAPAPYHQRLKTQSQVHSLSRKRFLRSPKTKRAR